jgi:hypothetical protein
MRSALAYQPELFTEEPDVALTHARFNGRFDRMVEKVIVIPLYGRSSEFATIDDALRFLDGHSVYEGCGDFRKYEVLISFTSGDRVEGSFKDKTKVRDFLQFIAKQ